MMPTDILNYRIVRHLGTGGMGSVYLAVNTNIDQQVAIKVLRPEVACNADLRARFKQEAEMLCSLDHPGIVKFLNYVETAQGVFLIMEYVKGITLENFITKRNGLIVEKNAYPLICEILDAFAYAHSKGIVHRDIKPSNIIITDDGHIKVMDFGIAQIVSESNVTQNKYITGTPSYMSPEQILGKDVDGRSDIFSLGVLIHNMLTGRTPYDTTTMTSQEIKRRMMNEQLPRMADYYPYVSSAIQLVVDKATQKLPELRYPNCEEMKSAVKKALAPEKISKPVLYTGIAVCVILLLAGFFIWDYFRNKVEYYKDYVEVFGVPEGIGSLSSREMAHRAATYKFEYSRYKLRRVTYVNSMGNLVDHTDSEDKDKIVDMTLSYNEGSGNIDVAKFRDKSGNVLYVKDYDNNFKTCTFKLDDELGTEMTLNAKVALFQKTFDINAEGRGKISKYILEYNDKGFLTKVKYAGFGNVLVPDGQGIFGRSYVLDKKGRVIEEHYLGKDGKPKATSFGLGIKKFTYDDDDNLIKITYLTTDGKPSSDGNNCPVVALTYDKWGNRLSEKYYDIDGNSAIRKDDSFAGILYEYNDDGFLVKNWFLGIDDRLTYINGASGQIIEYDENGYRKSVSYIDSKGNAAYWNDKTNGNSYHKVEIKNDERGNILELKFLDSSGKLIDSPSGAREVHTVDSVGRILSLFFLEESGKCYIPAQYGYAGLEVVYNSQGRVKKLTYLDENKNKMISKVFHICSFVKEYDARGNVTRIKNYDTNDKLIKDNDGVAVICFEYDENGNESARYFLDEREKPCTIINSYHKAEYVYDEQGSCIKIRFKNTSGALMNVDGCAGYDREYDARGNIIFERPVGAGGGLASGKTEVRLKYDNQDNVIERSFFKGKSPAINGLGIHKEVYKYNSSNRCVQEEYYGTNGLLKNVSGQNFAVVKAEYDEKGNNISKLFFTATGARGTDNANVHKYYNQFDKVTNKICHQISFGSDGKPVASNGIAYEGRVEYDKKGNMVKLICYDGYGKKVNGLKGWCELRMTYDDACLKTSESLFDVNGKPVIDNTLKYHKVCYAYNEYRKINTMKVYGVNGQKINCALGWHKAVNIYKNGEITNTVFYDINNRKISNNSGVNNKWKDNGESQMTATPAWREIWEGMAKQCPIESQDGYIIEQVIVDYNSVEINFRLENVVSDNLSDELKSGFSYMITYFRKSTHTPSFVSIKINVYNKYLEKIVTI